MNKITVGCGGTEGRWFLFKKISVKSHTLLLFIFILCLFPFYIFETKFNFLLFFLHMKHSAF